MSKIEVPYFVDDTIQDEIRSWVGRNGLKLSEFEIESISYKDMSDAFVLRMIEEKWDVERDSVSKTSLKSARYRAILKLCTTRCGRTLALLTGFLSDSSSSKSINSYWPRKLKEIAKQKRP